MPMETIEYFAVAKIEEYVLLMLNRTGNVWSLSQMKSFNLVAINSSNIFQLIVSNQI